jgi:hypothetical protein
MNPHDPLDRLIDGYYGAEGSDEEEARLFAELVASDEGDLDPSARPIALLAALRAELRDADEVGTVSALDRLLGAAPPGRAQAFSRSARPFRRWALAASLMAAAFAGGLWVGRGTGGGTDGGPEAGGQRLAALESEVLTLRRSIVVSLLGSPSEAAQLRGAALARELPSLGSAEIDLLTGAVRASAGVGVRLAALETLYYFSADGAARAGLEGALDARQPALVQSSWVDLMIACGQPPDRLREMAKSPDLDDSVRRKILSLIDA